MHSKALAYSLILFILSVVYLHPYIIVYVIKKTTLERFREEMYRNKIGPLISSNETVIYKTKHSFCDWPALIMSILLASLGNFCVIYSSFNIAVLFAAIAAMSLTAFTTISFYNYFYSYVVVTNMRIYWYAVNDMCRVHSEEIGKIDSLHKTSVRGGPWIYITIYGKKFLEYREFPDLKEFSDSLDREVISNKYI